MVDTTYAKIADAWISATNTKAYGGGRHTARALAGELYSIYFERQPNGDLRMMVAKYTVDGAGTVTVAGSYQVVDFQDTTVYGTPKKNTDFAAAICIDTYGGTERVLVAHTNVLQHADKIWLRDMDTSAPTTFTQRDNLRVYSSDNQLAERSAFQIIGRNGAGNIHIVYARTVWYGYTDSTLNHRQLTGIAATWGAAVAIDSPQVWPCNTYNRPGYRTMAAHMDSTGDIHVVSGYVYAAAPDETHVVHALYSGGSWSGLTSIWSVPYSSLSSIHTTITHLSMAIDTDDNPHAAWANDEPQAEGSYYIDGTRMIYAAYSGSWSTVEVFRGQYGQPASNLPAYVYFTSLGIDGDGDPHIVWTGGGFTDDFSDTTVNYAYRLEGSWYVYKLIENGVGGNWMPSIPHDVNPYPTLGRVNSWTAFTFHARDDADFALLSIDGFALGGLAAGAETLTLVETLVSHLASEIVDEVLTLGETAVPSGDWYREIEETLTLSEYASSTVSIEVEETLIVSDGVLDVLEDGEGVDEELTISETVSVSGEFYETINETLEFIEIASPGNQVSEILTLGETVLAAGPVNVSVGETLTVTEYAQISDPEGCETDYNSDPALPEDPDLLLTVEFSGPFGAPTLSMQLKRPDFHDIRDIILKDQIGYTDDGDHVIYHDEPMGRQLTLTWTQLSRLYALEVENFLEQMRGQLFRYRDYNGHNWQVYSLQNPAIVTDEVEQATVVMVLEGARVD